MVHWPKFLITAVAAGRRFSTDMGAQVHLKKLGCANCEETNSPVSPTVFGLLNGDIYRLLCDSRYCRASLRDSQAPKAFSAVSSWSKRAAVGWEPIPSTFGT